MQLPQNQNLTINKLSAVFNKKSTAYKFYWFVSILEIYYLKRNNRITFAEIIARMVANAWYPINYFKLSFGFQDKLSESIFEIKNLLNIAIDCKKEEIQEILLHTNNKKVLNLLNNFSLNVPYRFLSPWIPYVSDRDVVEKSGLFQNNCLYKIENDKAIVVNDLWSEYLLNNYTILLHFCYWNLSLYLQDKNPNVPDIPNKLIKEIERRPLKKQRDFWKIVFNKTPEIQCIYSGAVLTAHHFSVEHFIPFHFVSHDLLWNLLPVDGRINSSKNNKLPVLNQFIDDFSEIQQQAIKIVYQSQPNNKLLEDYLILGGNISDIIKLSKPDFKLKYYNLISPLIQIAENMGFEYWNYKKA